MLRPRSTASALTALLLTAVALAIGASPGIGGTVSWPPSGSLLVGEVVTGGVSASDEFVELVNAGATDADLAGLELVYVSSSGLTITRKAVWTGSLVLGPGQRLLLANAAGAFAGLADALYTGGLSADGGSIVLRQAGGSVVDAVGWGTAASAYVEGAAAPAPPARSSIERTAGGGVVARDTNDNATDFAIQAQPTPDSLGSPVPGPSPTASATDAPTPPSATETPASTASDAVPSLPSVAPTDSPLPTVSVAPSVELPSPTDAQPSSPTPTAPATPTPTVPATPTPTAPATPTPTPVPDTIVTIADARALSDGTHVIIEGVLTTRLGAFDDGRGAFVQDVTAGVAILAPAGTTFDAPAGTFVRASGTIGDRYGQRTIALDVDGLIVEGSAALPDPVAITTAAAAEAYEGTRVAIAGTVVATPDQLTDGLGLWVDDGSGAVRAVIGPAAQIAEPIGRGASVVVVGTLGQRVSGTSSGYRVMSLEPGGLVAVTMASPTPSASSPASPPPSEPVATQSGAATDAPSAPPSVEPSREPATPVPSDPPSPTASNSPTAAPSAELPPVVSIADARLLPASSRVHVRGVLTALPGTLSSANLIAIQDATGAIFVALPAPLDSLRMDAVVGVVGTLAAPYGQLEIRGVELVELGAEADPPVALRLQIADIGEAAEARVVTASGVVTGSSASGGRLSLTIAAGDATLRVFANAVVGIESAELRRGSTIEVTGIVGQRATALGRRDGYRLWIRDAADVTVLEEAAPEPTRSAKASPSRRPPVHATIAAALASPGAYVEIEATVTVAAGLLSVGGTAIVVADDTGGVAVLLPPGAAAANVGDVVRITGTVGHWHSGPRLAADSVLRLRAGSLVSPVAVSAVAPSLEWHLVRVQGTVQSVTHLGQRWRAVLRCDAASVAVVAEPAAAISSTGVVKGATLTVTGVVRRSPSDPSVFQVVPRSSSDVLVGSTRSTAASSVGRGTTAGASGTARATERIAAAAIAEVAQRLGDSVTLSGIVVSGEGEGALLDDGTGTIRLVGDRAADEMSLLEPGDAIEVSGRVVALAGGEYGLSVEPGTIVELAALRPHQAGDATASVGPWRLPDVPAASGRFAATGTTAPVAVGLIVLAAVAAIGLLVVQRRRNGLPMPFAGVLAQLAGASGGGRWAAIRWPRKTRRGTSRGTRQTSERPDLGHEAPNQGL